MKLEIGKRYIVHYHDPNYPCHCPCHHPSMGQFVRHVAPCCYDNSYLGPAICESEIEGRPGYYLFAIHSMRKIIVSNLDILSEVKDED
jgi:hypothetical protein